MRLVGLTIAAGMLSIATFSPASGQAPLNNAFTYQGVLDNGGVPSNGPVDLRFRLFDASGAGAQVGSTLCFDGVMPDDGLFTVSLDFGLSPFAGDARWMEVSVRSDSTAANCSTSTGYTALSPRQPLTAVPYALFALDGPGQAGFWAANGTHIYKTNSGSVGIGTNAPEAPFEVRGPVDSRMRVSHISAGGFAVAGPAVLEMKSNNVGIDHPYGSIRFLDTANAVRGSMEYGAGPALLDPVAMRFATEGATRMSIEASGEVGIGTVTPDALLHVLGSSDSALGGGGLIVMGDVAAGNISMDANEIMARNNGQASTLFLNHNGGNIHIDGGGTGTTRVGIGTNSPNSRLHVTTDSMQLAQFNQFGTSPGVQITSLSASTIYPALSVAGFSSNAPALRVTGKASVSVLEITGADVAEKFPTSECEKVEPGTVMEIDPANPGTLRIARGAYNRRVAGVVSGAGDIPLGAILGNLPGHEDAPPIALSGRVYVRCDASSGAIQPGDLLTTSVTAGHAMKVDDYPRAQGAIIGKAMSELPAGESGLVLVLVNLQ